MIQVQNLSKWYGTQELFDDVSLNFGPRDKVGLIGRNGYGKSTFLKILKGTESYDEGHIEIPRHVRVQSLEQDLAFSADTILEQVCLSLPAHDYGQEWKAESILMGLGFQKSDLKRAPHEFSSGMQVRLRLAQALVTEADLLLLDEPTNYLDIVSLRWLERFLQNWKGAFILVTHDQTFMERVVDITVGIHRGKMRKMKGGPSKLMEQIWQEEEIHERTRVRQEKKQAKTEVFIRNFRSGARSAGLVQSRIKALEKQDTLKKLEKIPEIRFHFESIPFHGGQLLRANNLGFGYDPQKPLIDKLSFSLWPKDRLAVIGPNGQGKSTLLKLLVGELELQAGKLKPHDQMQVGYFGPSTIDALSPQNTILAELMSLPNSKEREVRSICAALLFSSNDVKKEIRQLSGGERSRVALAKLMLSKHNILMLDEPTNHLDMESCQALTKALQAFNGAVLVVSHDERLIGALAERLIVFDGGRVFPFEKPYSSFLDELGWQEEADLNLKSFKAKSASKDDYEHRKALKKELRQVQNDQKQLEKEISKLDAQQEKNTEVLNQAYADKDQKGMLDYGAEAKRLHKCIEAAYQKLEDLMQKEEELSKQL